MNKELEDLKKQLKEIDENLERMNKVRSDLFMEIEILKAEDK